MVVGDLLAFPLVSPGKAKMVSLFAEKKLSVFEQERIHCHEEALGYEQWRILVKKA